MARKRALQAALGKISQLYIITSMPGTLIATLCIAKSNFTANI